MAEVTITGLPNASALTGAERVPMDQSGTTVDATTAAIAALAPQGTVTSVGLVAPTGFSVSGSPVTAAGGITLTYAAGYSVPTTASQTTWDTAYAERRQWDGGSTNLDAATGRASLGAAASGAVGSSGLTMATARLLGRTTAGTGAVEEITVSGATLSGGVLTIAGATTIPTETLTYAADIELDLASVTGKHLLLTLTGNVSFTTLNRAAGRWVTIFIEPGASQRSLTFPAGWVFIGPKPAAVAANKSAVLSVKANGTGLTDIRAVWGVQQ